MPNVESALSRLLERLALERERTPIWQPLLEETLAALQASGGRIERFHPNSILASVEPGDPSAEEGCCEFPLAAAGRIYGLLCVTLSPPRAFSSQQLELGQLCAAVAGMALQSESAERELDQFVRGAAHDLRGSLVRGATTAQLLARQMPEDSEERRMADRVTEDMSAAESLLRDMAAFAAAGTRTGPLQPVSVKAALDEARWNLKPVLQKHGATLVFEGADRMVTARERDLVEIFERLIDNSLKFSGEEPAIRIDAEAAPAGALISVRDNGPGIDARYAETVFEPFQRLHGKRFPGHGLGLAICRKLVGSLGGKIGVDVASVKGAVIQIRLPSGG